MVEHSLGKGEVDSSILSSSTIFPCFQKIETGPIPPSYTVDPGAGYGAASIALAVLDEGAYAAGDFSRARWTQLGPVVAALGVNDQTERSHVVFQNGKLYLFTISHHSTYSGNL